MSALDTIPVHDLATVLPALAELRIGATTTEAEAAAAMRVLQDWNRCAVGVVRFSGRTPWERHSEDELLYILEGEVELTVLTDSRELVSRARAGSVVVVPRRLWHRQSADARTTLLFVTGEHNDTSDADDPRAASGPAR